MKKQAISEYLASIGRKGGKAAAKNMTAAERKARAVKTGKAGGLAKARNRKGGTA